MQNLRLLIFGLIWSTIVLAVHADMIVLKDGRKLKGQIKKQDSETVTIDMNGIELTLPASRIERVEKQEEKNTNKGNLDFTKLYPVVGRQDEAAFKKIIKQTDLSNLNRRDEQKLQRMKWIVERKPVDLKKVKRQALEYLDQVRGYDAEKLLKDALEKNPYNLELRKMLIDYWREERSTDDKELMMFIAEHCSYYPDSELAGLAEELSEKTYEEAKLLAGVRSLESYLYLQLHLASKIMVENPDDTARYIPVFVTAAEALNEGEVLADRPDSTFLARRIAAFGVKDASSRKDIELEKRRREMRDKDWAKYYDNIERGRNVLIPNPRPAYEFALDQIYNHPFELLKKNIRDVPPAEWEKEIIFYKNYLNWALHYWATQDTFSIDTVNLMYEMAKELAAVNDAEKDGRDEVLKKLNAPKKDRRIAAMEFLQRYRGNYIEPVWFYTYEKTLEVYEGDREFSDRYDQHALDQIMDLMKGLERERNIPLVSRRVALIAIFADKCIEREEVKDRFIELRDTAVIEAMAYQIYNDYRRRNTRNMDEITCRQNLNALDALMLEYSDTRWAVKFEECKERYEKRLNELKE